MASNKRGKVSFGTVRQLMTMYHYACLCCGKTDDEAYLLADHIIPVSRDGSDDISNLQLLCFHCNATKGAIELDFRDPSWKQHRQLWSPAERAVREHFAAIGRPIALHPDFPIITTPSLYIELWNCIGYSEHDLAAALKMATDLGYNHAYSTTIANYILHNQPVAPAKIHKQRLALINAAAPPPTIEMPKKIESRKPRRVKTHLVRRRLQHQRRTR